MSNNQLVRRGNWQMISFDDEEAQMCSQDVVATAFNVMMSHGDMINSLKNGQSQLQTATQLLYQMTDSQFQLVKQQMEENSDTAYNAVQNLFNACDTKFMSVDDAIKSGFQLSEKRQEQLYELLAQAQKEMQESHLVSEISTENIAQLGNSINSIVVKLREVSKIARDAAANQDSALILESFTNAKITYDSQLEAHNKLVKEMSAAYHKSDEHFDSTLATFKTEATRQAAILTKLEASSELATTELASAKRQCLDLKEHIDTVVSTSASSTDLIKRSLETTLETLKKRVAELEEQITSTNKKMISRVSAVRATQSSEELIRSLTVEVDEYKVKVLSLGTRLSEAEVSISRLEAQARSDKESLQNSLERSIKALRAEFSELATHSTSRVTYPPSPLPRDPTFDWLKEEDARISMRVDGLSSELSKLKSNHEQLKNEFDQDVRRYSPTTGSITRAERSTSDILSTARLQGFISTASKGLLPNLFTNEDLCNTLAEMSPYGYPYEMSALMASHLSSIVHLYKKFDIEKLRTEIREKLQKVTPSSSFQDFLDKNGTRQDLAELLMVFNAVTRKEERIQLHNLITRARMTSDMMTTTKDLFLRQANGEAKIMRDGVEVRSSSILNF